MGRRTLLLIAAFLVAALGTTMVFLYVNGLEDKYLRGQDAQRILVAAGMIAENTTGADAQEQALFDLKDVPKRDVAPGAVSSADQIADKVALAPIYPGEQILTSKFGTPGTGALPIPEGKLAVSVQVSDPARVAGFVQPGSEVMVFLAKDSDATVLLPKAQVIAVGGSTSVASTTSDQQSSDQSRTITLALDVVQTKKIVYAQKQGDLYFGLLGADSPVAEPGGPVSDKNLYPR